MAKEMPEYPSAARHRKKLLRFLGPSLKRLNEKLCEKGDLSMEQLASTAPLDDKGRTVDGRPNMCHKGGLAPTYQNPEGSAGKMLLNQDPTKDMHGELLAWQDVAPSGAHTEIRAGPCFST